MTTNGYRGRGRYHYWYSLPDFMLADCLAELQRKAPRVDPELIRELEEELTHRRRFDQVSTIG